MNSHFEGTLFISKFCADFTMQNPFKVQSTQPESSQYQFIEHFPLKEWCMAKSAKNLDVNIVLSKCELNIVAAFEST